MNIWSFADGTLKDSQTSRPSSEESTNAFKAGIDHMYIRPLMGQKSGLEDAYLKLSEEDC